MLKSAIGSLQEKNPGPLSVPRRELLYRAAALAVTLQISRPLRSLALSQAAPTNGKQKEPPPTLEAKIKKIIVEQLGVDEKEVTPSAKLEDDLGADSLDIVELSMAMEEAFELEISDEEVCKWKMVSDVVHTVQTGLDKKQTKQHQP